MVHMRQDSNETATVTLMSYPSTPSLSSRAPSPDQMHNSPPTPGTIQLERFAPDGHGGAKLKPGKSRKIPMPLNLDKEKEIEAALGSATQHPANRVLKPPMSPAWDILKGMEIPVSPSKTVTMELSPVSPVGVAF
jgi:hypothetical protein